jgi:hypothetical protein
VIELAGHMGGMTFADPYTDLASLPPLGSFDAEAYDPHQARYPAMLSTVDVDGAPVTLRGTRPADAAVMLDGDVIGGVATDGVYTFTFEVTFRDDEQRFARELDLIARYGVRALHRDRLMSRLGALPMLDMQLLSEIASLEASMPERPKDWNPGEPLHSIDDAALVATTFGPDAFDMVPSVVGDITLGDTEAVVHIPLLERTDIDPVSLIAASAPGGVSVHASAEGVAVVVRYGNAGRRTSLERVLSGLDTVLGQAADLAH